MRKYLYTFSCVYMVEKNRYVKNYFVYHINVKLHVQVHFTIASQFHVNVNVEFYVRMNVGLVFSRFLTFIWWRKTGMLKFFYRFFYCVRGFWRQMPVYTLLMFALDPLI